MTKIQSSKNFFMKRVLELAAKGRGFVEPNPMVGAVVVKNGKIVNEGFHKKFGGPHAEVIALRGINAGGATLYVNLEPCIFFHGKKTPSCCDAIIRAGISKVIIGMKDPNPKIFGRGIAKLRSAGISVEVGGFTFLPFVALKIAMSLDGKIATKSGESKWITSRASRKFAHALRDEYDAILVGKNTVLQDNPALAGKHREPFRVILDSRGEIPKSAKVFRDSNVFRATATGRQKQVQLIQLLRELAMRGVRSVLVEGGSEIFGSFVDEKLVDRVYIFIAPKILGGRDAKSAIGGEGFVKLQTALRLKIKSIKRFNEDLFLDCAVD